MPCVRRASVRRHVFCCCYSSCTRSSDVFFLVPPSDSAADHQLEEHQNAIIAAIRTALIDENADVRAAAARVFDQVRRKLGHLQL